MTVTVLSIPSPSTSAIHIGPLAIHAYAICIVVGIVIALIVSERRWAARGGKPGQMQDLALWAVPFGIVGGRVYHVITDHDLYFGHGRNPWNAFAIWNGGMGVWGAIPLGALGIILGARHMKVRLWPLLDTIAPTVLLAQGIGRWGNWFNQELFGRPTSLPWGLKIDPSHFPGGPDQFPVGTTFHPTFLYECLWDVAMFFVVVWAERKFRLGFGRTTALYVMTYCVGRFFVERLRIDNVELNDVLGMRWSDWMAIILFVVAFAYFLWSAARHPGRESSVYQDGADGADEADEADEADSSADDLQGADSPVANDENGTVVPPDEPTL